MGMLYLKDEKREVLDHPTRPAHTQYTISIFTANKEPVTKLYFSLIELNQLFFQIVVMGMDEPTTENYKDCVAKVLAEVR